MVLPLKTQSLYSQVRSDLLFAFSPSLSYRVIFWNLLGKSPKMFLYLVILQIVPQYLRSQFLTRLVKPRARRITKNHSKIPMIRLLELNMGLVLLHHKREVEPDLYSGYPTPFYLIYHQNLKYCLK